MIKKRTILAGQMESGMLIELDDDTPDMVRNVVKTEDSVMFDIGQEKFCIEPLTEITQVVRLVLICGEKV